MRTSRKAFLDNQKEDVWNYCNTSLADFYRVPGQRLMMYAVTFILMAIGVFGVLAIYDLSSLLVDIPLKFMGINAWHSAANFVLCFILVDMTIASFIRPWGGYERRTVGRAWIIFFVAYVVGFVSERTLAYKLIGLYEPGLIFLWQAAPHQRAGVWPMIMLITPFWLVIMATVMKLITSKQAQTEDLMRVRIDAILKERVQLSSRLSKKGLSSADANPNLSDGHLQLPTDPGVGPISASDISHVSAEDHYLRIYYRNAQQLKNTLIRMPLKELLSLLSAQDFARIHRSHIVNLGQISGLKRSGQSVTLSMNHADVKLPVSRYRLPQLLPVLERFLNTEP